MSVQQRLAQSYENYYRTTLGLPDWQARVQKRLRLVDEAHNVRRMLSLAGDLSAKSVLDLGCGWGGALLILKRRCPTLRVWGMEPDDERIGLARMQLQEAGIMDVSLFSGEGERLPLPDESVDVIYSHQVLEHVHCRPAVVAEMRRVLRPGGLCHLMLPNYLAFSEPHYKIAWIPYLPRPIARLYLRLRGRPPGFVDYFKYTTPLNVKPLFDSQYWECTDLTLLELRQKAATSDMQATRRKIFNALPRTGQQLLFHVYRLSRITRQEYLLEKRRASQVVTNHGPE